MASHSVLRASRRPLRSVRAAAVALALAISAAALALPGAAQDGPPKAGEPESVLRTRKRLATLRAELEAIRGEKLKTEVVVRHAPEESLTSDATSELDRRYDTRSDQIARAYARIGLFPKGYDSRQLARATASQIVAYYDPDRHAMFVVKTDLGEDAADTTAVHELQHALQDQRFDLVAFYHFSREVDPIATNDDARLARRYVVEGEASYVATLYDATKHKVSDRIDELLEKRAALTRQELSRLERREAALLDGGKSLLAALNACDSLPSYLYRQLVEPYVKGPAIIARVRRKGGWKAVDELFTKPPASTRQLLHPERASAAPETLEVPDLSVLLGNGYKRTFENTLGEVGIACALEARALTRRLPEAAARVAAGWTGDRFQAYENPSRESCALWLTSWESEEAAKDFELGGREILKGESSTTAESLVERRGKRVLLVLGVPRRRAKGLVDATLGEKK